MEIQIYKDKYKNKIESYNLTEDQLRYTGHPIDCIEIDKEDKDYYSIMAMEEDKLVTFFVLHKNEGVKPYSENSRSILLRAFSTDFYCQGKGYAKQALKLLPNFVKENFKDINEIILAVNIKNEAAQGLYKKCGFKDEGIRKMGKKGELIIMSYHIGI